MALPLIPLAIAAAASAGTWWITREDSAGATAKAVPVGAILGASAMVGGYFIPNRALRYGTMAAGGAMAAHSLYTRWSDKARATDAYKADGNLVEQDQARRLYNALHQARWLGITWMTDEFAAFAIAREITCWDKVKARYKVLYNRDLPADVREELSPGEEDIFYGLLQENNKHQLCKSWDKMTDEEKKNINPWRAMVEKIEW